MSEAAPEGGRHEVRLLSPNASHRDILARRSMCSANREAGLEAEKEEAEVPARDSRGEDLEMQHQRTLPSRLGEVARTSVRAFL